MKCFFFLLFFLPALLVGQDFKIGYSEPAADANPEYRHVVLQIDGLDNTSNPATPKGILIPSMTLAQRDQIASAPMGLMIFVTTSGSEGFYYNVGSGTMQWEKVASGLTNSRNNVFTVTDAEIKFDNNASTVGINTIQNNTLEIGKNGQAFIQIPQGAGSNNTESGIEIADNGSFNAANSASLVTFTSANKGILLPRITDLNNITTPPFGLMVIKEATDGTQGVYIQMGTPSSPAWQLITTTSSP